MILNASRKVKVVSIIHEVAFLELVERACKAKVQNSEDFQKLGDYVRGKSTVTHKDKMQPQELYKDPCEMHWAHYTRSVSLSCLNACLPARSE